MKWINKNLAILVILVGILLPNYRTGAKIYAPTITPEASKEVIFDSNPDSLDLWIEKLVQAESNGQEDIVIIDSNGRLSKSCLQFQDRTFQAYYPLIISPTDPSKMPQNQSEWDKAIMDCKTQKRLAKAMILDNRNNWQHWRNSVNKIGLPPK